MFTDQELKVLHYQMWDYIADTILEEKRVINIYYTKRKFLEDKVIDKLEVFCECFMCQYVKQHYSLNELDPCKYCPSALNVSLFRGCLSGLYSLCKDACDYRTQLILALAIRDSWR